MRIKIFREFHYCYCNEHATRDESHLLETVSWISQCQSTQLSTVFSTTSKILGVENGEVAVDGL
jgi:hypothetical protein